jgi:hypothetical protein
MRPYRLPVIIEIAGYSEANSRRDALVVMVKTADFGELANRSELGWLDRS